MDRFTGSLDKLTLDEYIELAPNFTGLSAAIDGTAPDAEEEPASAARSPVRRGGSSEGIVLTLSCTDDVFAVRGGGDEVRFSYWAEPRRTSDGRVYDDPYNLDAYEGARRGLMTEAELSAAGYTTSERRIFAANAGKESGGSFGAVNTWDRQLVSWGVAQFAGRAGTLAAVLRLLKREQPACFARWFRANGVDVADGPHPALKDGGYTEANGLHLLVTDEAGQVYPGDKALLFIRTQPRLLGLLMLAGNDLDVQRAQCRFWLARFLRRALQVEVFGAPIGEFVTSEYGAGIVVRLYNWMPGNVRKWSESVIAGLAGAFPGRDLGRPAAWDAAVEAAFLRGLGDLRKRLRGSDYGNYGAELRRERGSFLADERPPTRATPSEQPPAEPARTDFPDCDVTAKSPPEKRKRTRAWSEIDGIVLHQTGVHGFGERAWPKVTAHLGVHSDGRVFWIHPLQARLSASNGFNSTTVAIEVAGNFRGEEARPESLWKTGGGPSTLTPEMIEGLRRAIRFLCAEVERHGGKITHVFAHRQASAQRPACPGEAIWRAGGVWAQTTLGLDDGGQGFTIDDGRAIPPAWDERRVAERRRGLEPWPDGMDLSEADVEFPDADERADLDRARRGVVIHEVPVGLELRVDPPASARRGWRGDMTETEPEFIAGAMLSEDDELVDELVFLPTTTPARRGATRSEGALRFEVPVRADESAIALLEEDGVYRWVLPRRDDEPASQARQFVLEGAALAHASPSGRRGPGWFGRLCIRVFRFIARAAIGAGIRFFEGRRREGLVHLRSTYTNDWVAAAPADVASSDGRVLLLIHGTFSSTLGCFGALALGQGRDLLARALGRGDLVIGFDHHTLGKTPEENAQAIAAALTKAKLLDREIRVICHSRGGLVTRCLAATLAELRQRPLEQVICVATTETGTPMATPENWGAFADSMTNLAAAAGSVWALLDGGAIAGKIVQATITGVACLLRAVADVALSPEVPGLAVMTPGSEALANIPRWTEKMVRERSAVAANFEDVAKTSGLSEAARRALLWACDAVADRILGGVDNDLVVPGASSLDDLKPAQYQYFASGTALYHVNYFGDPEVVAFLIRGIGLAVHSAPKALGRKKPAALSKSKPHLPRRIIDAEPLSEGAGPVAPTIVDLFMQARAPAQVRPREEFWVTVDLSRESMVVSDELEVHAQIAADESLHVELVARQNAEVGAAASATMDAPGPGARLRLCFDARAQGVGPVRLRVLVRQAGVIAMYIDVEAEATDRLVAPAGPEVVRTASNEAVARHPGQLPEHQLTVLEVRELGGLRLRYQLCSPSNEVHQTFESRTIRGELSEFVTRQFDGLEADWDLAGRDVVKFEQTLAARGARLYEQIVPRELQEVLWRLRDDLKGLQILSDECVVPWELLCIKAPDRPLTSDSRFFAELGIVHTHWGAVPAAEIHVKKALYVAPDYPARHALASSPAECAMLRELLGAAPLTPRTGAILPMLASPGQFGLLHFVCHGAIDNDEPRLLLGDAESGRWEPDELTALLVSQQAQIGDREHARPLVFINACSVGRGQWLLSSAGGWAPAFLERGAGALIAPLWSVGDEAARHFAGAFYEALLAGEDFASATLTARRAARKLGDPTWLAYAVYADPHGRMTV
jgi:hypothetical protein